MNNFEKMKQDFNNMSMEKAILEIMLYCQDNACFLCAYNGNCGQNADCIKGITEYLQKEFVKTDKYKFNKEVIELRKVKELFEEISNTSSRLAKEKILRDNQNNEKFIECLKFLLDDNIVTGISNKKLNKDVKLKPAITPDFMDILLYLKEHNTGSDEDISVVKTYLSMSPNDMKDFLSQLITKKYRLGLNAKTVNKVIPNLIPQFNVMLASSYKDCKDKIDGNTYFILTTKLDGGRIIVIKDNDKLDLYTRQGKRYEGLVDIEKSFKSFPNGVYDGELLAIGEFETSGEQYKETMKRSRIKGVKHGLKMICYDYIENIDDFWKGKHLINCITRKVNLCHIIKEQNIEFIEYLEPLYIGKDIKAIAIYSQQAIENGEEGIMLNICDTIWENKRVKTLLKVKEFNTADVLVYDVYEGEGNLKGKLGGIKTKFLHNGIECECSCGSGFNLSEREYYWQHKDELVGKIVTLRYFETSTNQIDKKKISLRFPTWLNIIRNDKTLLEETNID